LARVTCSCVAPAVIHL